MTAQVDLSTWNPDDLRRSRAEQVRTATDVAIPRLDGWNYDACQFHDEPRPDCEYRSCGGDLFSHQRVGAMWMYLIQSGILADLPGVGKTSQVLALAALLKQRGELNRRMLVVCQTPAAAQWAAEISRWTPGLTCTAILSGMSKAERLERYSGARGDFDILVIGWHMMLRDSEILEKLNFGVLVCDDVDPIVNHDTKVHEIVVRLSERADRVINSNASVINTDIRQLHAALVPCGGLSVLGSRSSFEARHIRTDTYTEIDSSGEARVRQRDVGFRNGEELRSKVLPLILRRTYEDLDDVRMPVLMPPKTVWLDMHPAQRKRYAELQQGVLKIKQAEGEKVKQVSALTAVNYGATICSGLAGLKGEEDRPGTSVKLDWLLHQVTTSWHQQKIVVFIRNTGLVAAAEARLNAAGIGTAKIWGPDAGAAHRAAEIKRFWEDPQCRVMLGTSALERSLNLQNANILVNIDMLMNPSRVKQLAGRIRRAGSKHSHIFIFNVLTTNSQEERYEKVLASRAAMSDYIFSESSEMFAKLTPMELLSLISP